MRIWGVLRTKQKIRRQLVVDAGGGGLDGLNEAIDSLCLGLDIPHPMVLPRHERDFTAFRRAVFHPDEFVESFVFDLLEVIDITEKD